MEKEKEKGVENWSEAVEDLVEAGDVESAISLLESVVQTLNPSDPASQLPLSSALSDLANLYSSKGFSLQADQLLSRASLLNHLHLFPSPSIDDSHFPLSTVASRRSLLSLPKPPQFPSHTSSFDPSSCDDWEALADREPGELLPTVASNSVSGISNLTSENAENGSPKRRGRGTFSYKKQELYSDQVVDSSVVDVDWEETHCGPEDNRDVQSSKYGTSHVLVLADFSPSTRTTELEKLFENFKDRGFVIRWVNDTVALAVFRSPSVALEAQNSVRCSFTTRILDEDDTLLSSIKARGEEASLAAA